jgi:hypothetical protein
MILDVYLDCEKNKRRPDVGRNDIANKEVLGSYAAIARTTLLRKRKFWQTGDDAK